ncbi:hypothetical protein M427DRAFT_147307 [Gonapodya prolifera JEL478]|uniref:RING-type domain-containing protein n=1 Tax=Gonapodya prolifera (strain JEL478) TaxID=1344416 RepID=A0A139A690_GONPJ|nr:hypothetical protein M427DRAFT_147307 [Gonapodya prolifera JEL478]|eukprot:KXS11965.1 hypothetical protein M427DRAFT_147307 [Gonapodya prolifera JEL478]
MKGKARSNPSKRRPAEPEAGADEWTPADEENSPPEDEEYIAPHKGKARLAESDDDDMMAGPSRKKPRRAPTAAARKAKGPQSSAKVYVKPLPPKPEPHWVVIMQEKLPYVGNSYYDPVTSKFIEEQVKFADFEVPFKIQPLEYGGSLRDAKNKAIVNWPKDYTNTLEPNTSDNLYNLRVILKESGAFVLYSVDMALLDWMVENGQLVPRRSFLLRCMFNLIHPSLARPLGGEPVAEDGSALNISAQTNLFGITQGDEYRLMEKIIAHFDKSSPPFKGNAVVAAQPSGLKVKMLAYQLKALSWMLDVENHVISGQGFQISSVAPFEEFGTLFDFRSQNMYPAKLPPSSNRMYAMGGILADKMGLGKTVTVLGLASANPSPLKTQPSPYLTTLGGPETHLFPTPATLIICPSHLVKQWQEEIERHMEGEPKVLVITTKPQHQKITYFDVMTADFVVVSFQFMSNPAYNESLQQFYEADKDVRPWYDHRGKIKNPKVPDTELMNYCMLLGRDMKRRPDALAQTSPYLEHFRFHRLICDEAHEVLADHDAPREYYGRRGPKKNAVLQQLCDIRSSTRWYVTGSPFTKGKSSFIGALRFLGWRVEKDRTMERGRFWEVTDADDTAGDIPPPRTYNGSMEDNNDDISDSPIGPDIFYSLGYGSRDRFDAAFFGEAILSNLYCRRSKEDVEQEIQIPPTQEEVIMLDMTDVERGMYMAAQGNRLRQRQICCHLQISNADRAVIGTNKRTLSEIRDIMIEHQIKCLKEANAQVVDTQKSIDATKREVADIVKEILISKTGKTQTLELLKKAKERSIESLKGNLTRLEKQIVSLEKSQEYFESIQGLKDHGACLICLEEELQRPAILQACAHIFCFECIVQWFNKNPQCPSCRKAIKGNEEITEIIEENQIQAIKERKALDTLREQYGTKVARLIDYVQQTQEEMEDARFLVFSQWDELLHQVGDILKENGVPNVWCQGNVHQRNRAISKFRKADNVRLMMLSLETAASGTNLIEASHVILLDAIQGTPQYVSGIEGQAIGRAHRLGQDKTVTVVRMVIKDTVEHEIFLHNRSGPMADGANLGVGIPAPVPFTSKNRVAAPGPSNRIWALDSDEEEYLELVKASTFM